MYYQERGLNGIFKKLLHKDKKTAGAADTGPADVSIPEVPSGREKSEIFPKDLQERNLRGAKRKLRRIKNLVGEGQLGHGYPFSRKNTGSGTSSLCSTSRAERWNPSGVAAECSRMPRVRSSLAERRLQTSEEVNPANPVRFYRSENAMVGEQIKLAELEIRFAEIATGHRIVPVF